MKYIKIIFGKLASRKLIIKREKCDFYKHEVDFLGFVVGREGIKMDPTKIEKVLDWPEPEGQENRSHNILRQNEDGSLSPNTSILAAIITIESKTEQRLKKIY